MEAAFGALAAAPTSLLCPLADDARLDDNDDRYLDDLFTSWGTDPRFALNADFDWLRIACKQAGEVKPAKMADIVAVDEEA